MPPPFGVTRAQECRFNQCQTTQAIEELIRKCHTSEDLGLSSLCREKTRWGLILQEMANKYQGGIFMLEKRQGAFDTWVKYTWVKEAAAASAAKIIVTRRVSSWHEI